MKAVNLIPQDASRNGAGGARSLPQGPAVVVLGLLAVALGLVTIYVLTQNTISERKTTLAKTQTQLAVAKVQAAQLNQYAQFQQLAQARVQTVRQIATSRFDWHAALSDISKVVPANTSLQTLVGTVSPDTSISAPGASAGGASGVTTSLRGAIAAPAFEIRGCTKTQDDVARLMSRMRLMDGVTRVSFADSQKPTVAPGTTSVASGSGSGAGCGANAPNFDLVVFYKPLPGAASTGVAGSAATVATTGTTTTTSTAASTPAAGAPTTSQQTSTISTSTVSQVGSTGSSGGSK